MVRRSLKSDSKIAIARLMAASIAAAFGLLVIDPSKVALMISPLLAVVVALATSTLLPAALAL